MTAGSKKKSVVKKKPSKPKAKEAPKLVVSKTIFIPSIRNEHFPEFTVNRKPLTLAEDRKAAVMLLDDHRDQKDGKFFRLPSYADKFNKRLYRHSTTKNFTSVMRKSYGYWYLYKTFARADKLLMHDAFVAQLKYLMNIMQKEKATKEQVLQYMGLAPLAARYRKFRRRTSWLRIGMAKQPLNARCMPMMGSRKAFASIFKDDRGFCPMFLGLNLDNVRKSLEKRKLQIEYQAKKDKPSMKSALKEFKETNKEHLKERLRFDAADPIILPLGHFGPMQMFHPSSLIHNADKLQKRPICYGKISPSQFMSEFNQFPADFSLHYFVLRANRNLDFEIREYSPLKNVSLTGPTESAATRYQYYGHSCRKVTNTVDIYGRLNFRPITLRRSFYRHEVDPAVSFKPRKEKDSPLVAQVFRFKEYDAVSLESISGFSTESIASTATLSPGQNISMWRESSKMKDMCTFRADDRYCQNRRTWKLDAKAGFAGRLSLETEERVIMAGISSSKKLCFQSKNEYFQRIMQKDKDRKIRRHPIDEQNIAYALECLLNAFEATDGTTASEGSLLEETFRRIFHFYPYPEMDKYKGLDITPGWRAAIDSGWLKPSKLVFLSHLISSHDSWVESSPISDSSRHWRCDKMPVEKRQSPLLAIEVLWIIAMSLVLFGSLMFISLTGPFDY